MNAGSARTVEGAKDYWMRERCTTSPWNYTTQLTTTAAAETATATLFWMAVVCQRPDTSYVPNVNPRRQGYCQCSPETVCAGSQCEAVRNNEGDPCSSSDLIPKPPGCISRKLDRRGSCSCPAGSCTAVGY